MFPRSWCSCNRLPHSTIFSTLGCLCTALNVLYRHQFKLRLIYNQKLHSPSDVGQVLGPVTFTSSTLSSQASGLLGFWIQVTTAPNDTINNLNDIMENKHNNSSIVNFFLDFLCFLDSEGAPVH